MIVLRQPANAKEREKRLKERGRILPAELNKRAISKRLAIFDTETDPFAVGRVVKPFAVGFYIIDTDEYYDFWGDDCIAQFFDFLKAEFPKEEFLILAHNGGNFDFYFIADYFDSEGAPFLINGRIVKVMAQGQEFRDSYAMIPVALGNALKADDGGKIEIDYDKFERPVREQHRREILDYQEQDCRALAKLVSRWYEMFGDKLTMASSALARLRSFHGIENMNERMDALMRPYYFGGRCQAFEVGELFPVSTDKFLIYDINSSYPASMKYQLHPVSRTPVYEKTITERTHFAHIRAWSNGALPRRLDNGGLEFPVGVYDFYANIHEIRAGRETGNLRIQQVYDSFYFEQETTLAPFVDEFYNLRLKADADKNEVDKLFFKLVLNSSYGKLAQDPRNYETWLFDPEKIPQPIYCETCHARYREGLPEDKCEKCLSFTHDAHGWYLHTIRGEKQIYCRPQKLRAGAGFFNVATAASITSASRALLLRGINNAVRPIYVDTDSIICEGLSEDLHPSRLGAWKLEETGDRVCIAGKKLYAVFQGEECVKKASKGVRLEGEEIARISKGDTIEYANPVPKFHLDGSATFITRAISRTGIVDTEVRFDFDTYSKASNVERIR